MNREYSDNAGSLENCLDLGKTDELMDSNSTFCDEKLVILSSALAAKTTVPERLPISSSSCITSEDQNRLTSSTLTGTNSETSDTSTRKNIVARFVSRPSTLLPSSSSLAQPLDVIKAQRQAVSKFADGINQTIHPTSSNNLTPCYWSSDLQNLSPILTPSTWKLLKNLTSSSCNNNTTTTNNGINTNTIQQSFLLTPTLSPLYPVLPTQAFTSITNVNNSLLINPTTVTTTNINNTTCSSLETTFDNCDNNTNNNRTSESSNILSKDNDNDKSIVDESSRIILMQQSSQLNGQ
ncbi:unnamed protein product [Schistosoma curassoni]|uniref:Uncharacterized protein n=1 Tax=Schistosoma curassoni TaxID=6186 RepID=A0A183KME9_9TREM|nr:unnamed protein product [Schistosoma curassoni]